MYSSLRGVGVVITGGASGIGAEMVRRFVAQGALVSFLDIDDIAAAAVVSATGARYEHCDLTDIAALRKALVSCDELCPVRVLINNAARDDRHALFSVEPDGWRRALSLNLDHQFFATQTIAARMMQRGQRGSIILFSSVAFLRGKTGMVGYTTSKAAIHGLTRTLSRELGEAAIRVNCVLPGAVLTERQAALWRSPEVDAGIQQSQALKMTLLPTHVASMALFLASDEAAGCTGQSYIVDAGISVN